MPITDENQRPALLPCPFCGSKADYKYGNPFVHVAWVECTFCWAGSMSHETETDTAEKWNARHITPANRSIA